MSNMYAIKEETLTAIGDAVRLKTIGSTKAPYVSNVDKSLAYNSVINVELPNSVKNIKITGTGRYGRGNPATSSSVQSLGIAPGIFSSSSSARSAEGYFIAYEYNSETIYDTYYFDFEALVEGNTLTMVTSKHSSSSNDFRLTYTAIGLDENGNEFAYTPLEMAEAINGLDIIPSEALTITGDCRYKFAYGGSDWLINSFGDKITTQNITTAANMFENSTVKHIPFVINAKNNLTLTYMFYRCQNLEEIPQVNTNVTSPVDIGYVFAECRKIREVPEWFGDYLEQSYKAGSNTNFFGPFENVFQYCYSLRSIPEKVMKYMATNGKVTGGTYYTMIYGKPFTNCYCLDELLDVYCDDCVFTSNQFSSWFGGIYRAKNITFATNEDGTPVVREWKSQTIDLSRVGANTTESYFISYNSGITKDKRVKDDATYQALKNDPDWYSLDYNYSRYNHDSAVNTINSLPDCSAYGTNTIKFLGAEGALTDGGAINTLTEEEIAVAAAKGWTVTLV